MSVRTRCMNCQHRQQLIHDTHSRCLNTKAHVRGDATGIKGGWFNWPSNFDPVWLAECDGFEKRR